MIIILKKVQIEFGNSKFTNQIFSLAMGICINITNTIMLVCIRTAGKYEYWETHTKYQSVVAYRSAFLISLNTAMGLVLGNWCAYEGFSFQTTKFKAHIFMEQGLAADIWS